MDFWIDIGFSILFRFLKERKDVERYKPAIRKLIRTYQLAFPDDEIWQEVSARGNGQ